MALKLSGGWNTGVYGADLTNQSKIKPSIAFLKPISAAIAIGTGGPFRAEDPIIATSVALGTTCGQFPDPDME